MKTTYSRRELYALGEPIGESSTYELAGRRVYGGGGGIVGDIVGGVGDIVGGAADAVGGLGEGVIDTVKDVGSNIDDAVNELPGGWKLPLAAAAAYYGMPSGMGESGGLSGWDAAMADVAGSGGMGQVLPQLGGWDAAMADLAGSSGMGDISGIAGLDPYEIFGSGASQWGGAGEYMDLGALSGTDLGGIGGSPNSWGSGTSGSNFGSKIARALGSSMTGGKDGLTLGGGLLGAAGIAGLMNMLKEDNKRYGTPGRQDMPSPLSQFNYSPSTFRAPTVDPAAFRPVGAPTAKVGYAYGGPVEAMSNANAIGMNTGYPQADITGHAYATPWQTPVSQNVVQGTADTGVNRMNGQMLAEGGITGDGNLNLNIPLDIGGGRGGPQGANGYQAAGSGSGSSFTAPSVSGGMFGQARAGGYGQSMDSRYASAGLDPNAIRANPQGMQSFMQQAQQREKQYPGSTMLAGLYAGQPAYKQTYEQYLAGRSPLQQDVQLTRQQFENPTPSAAMSNPNYAFARGGTAYASGGISDLGGYSDGGRMLKGPGDGMSDSIPASISGRQPARLADGEFVVPADVVSHLGNGSTDAGAKQLYKMMDKVRAARTGRKAQGKQINPKKYMPA